MVYCTASPMAALILAKSSLSYIFKRSFCAVDGPAGVSRAFEYSMAAASARSNSAMPKAPFSLAPAWAESRTFSNTRGTPRIRCGRERWNSRVTVVVSAQCDWVAPPTIEASDTALARTWASGRNVRMRLPGRAMTPMSLVRIARTSDSQLLWSSMQPLGRPVVPEV